MGSASRVAVLSAVVSCVLATAAAVPRRVEAQEIQLTGPLACAPALPCKAPRRHGLLLLAPGVMASLDDPTRTTVLAAGTVRYFTSERLGFGIFVAHRIVDLEPEAARAAATRSVAYAERGHLAWAVAPEIAYAIGVGRLTYDVPWDWHVSAGPMLSAIERGDTKPTLAATIGSSLTLFFTRSNLRLALDGRFVSNAPANAYVGVSLGFGIRLGRGCRSLEDEASCPL